MIDSQRARAALEQRFSILRWPLLIALLGTFAVPACAVEPHDGGSPPTTEPITGDAPGANVPEVHVPPAKTPFGFTPFPFDSTPEAVDRANAIIADFGQIYALHFEPGIPWAEAFADKPFPAAFQASWDDFVRRKPAGKPVYIVLEPIDQDRKGLAPAAKDSSIPKELRGARLDDDAVKRAYLNFARRAVKQFKPDIINLGLESGELAGRHPDKWPEFAALYEHVRGALKKDDPKLKVGISFGLQMLMRDDVAKRSKALVESSDYLGLSFYPFMTPFNEKFGADPLPAPPAEWKKALDWAHDYTDKPIAICETGYTTRDIELPVYKLKMHGDTMLQQQYLVDLAEYARKDDYLFVIWYLATDYDRLYAKLPAGDGANLLWRNIGLFDGELRAKPAWKVWKQLVGRADAADPGGAKSAAPGAKPTAGQVRIGFEQDSQLFAGPPTDKLALDAGAAPAAQSMRWSFEYKKGRFQWCAKEISAGTLGGKKSMSLSFRSDHEGPVLIELEESDGEGFYALLEPGKDWQKKTIELSSLTLDTQKKKDGHFDPSRVVKILLADSGAASGSAKGERTLWFSDWTFE